jgi:hypothetical protein
VWRDNDVAAQVAVSIPGSQFKASTNEKGEYALHGVPVGPCKLVFSDHVQPDREAAVSPPAGATEICDMDMDTGLAPKARPQGAANVGQLVPRSGLERRAANG